MDEQTTPPPPPPPPVQSVPEPEKPPSWPTAFGVIGIILAAFGLLGGCCGVAMPLAWPHYINWLEGLESVPQEQVDMAKASMPPALWAVVGGLVGIIVSVILLVGAIRLIRRQASGVPLVKFWAWFTIPWSLISYVINMFIQMRAASNAGSDQPQHALSMYFGLVFGGCWVLVLGVILPLFVIYWFTREPVRAEIARWQEEWRGVI
jgi:hypothetical protein